VLVTAFKGITSKFFYVFRLIFNVCLMCFAKFVDQIYVINLDKVNFCYY
jgi:hypothetical protein